MLIFSFFPVHISKNKDSSVDLYKIGLYSNEYESKRLCSNCSEFCSALECFHQEALTFLTFIFYCMLLNLVECNCLCVVYNTENKSDLK